MQNQVFSGFLLGAFKILLDLFLINGYTLIQSSKGVKIVEQMNRISKISYFAFSAHFRPLPN